MITRSLRRVLRKLISPSSLIGWLSGEDLEHPGESPLGYLDRFAGWVYFAVEWNARTVAAVPLRVYSKRKTTLHATKALSRQQKAHLEQSGKVAEAELLDHPLGELLSHPSRNAPLDQRISGHSLMELTSIYLDVLGEAFWFMINGPLAVPVGLQPLLAQYVTPELNDAGRVMHYTYGKMFGMRKTLPLNRLVIFQLPNPNNDVQGLSPLRAALAPADLSQAVIRRVLNLVSNNARPDFIISTEGVQDQDQVDMFYEKWDARFKGVNNVGRPAVFGGAKDIKTLSFSPRDTGELSFAQAAKELILACYGVNAGIIEKSQSRAEAEAHEYAHGKHTATPRLTLIQNTINDILSPLFDEDIFVLFDSPVPEDREFRLREREANIRVGYSSTNEERIEDGKPPRPEPEADQLRGGGGIGAVPQPPYLLRMQPPVSEDSPFVRPTQRVKGPQPAALPRLRGKLRRVTSEFLSEAVDVAVETLREGEEVKRLATKFPLEEIIRDFDAKAVPVMKDIAELAAAHAGRVVGVSVSTPVLNPFLLNWIKEYTFKFALSVSRSLESRMHKVIEDGVRGGLSVVEVADDLEKMFGPKYQRWKSYQVALTETSRAYNNAAIVQWGETGVVEQKEWGADANSCPFCLRLNGRRIALSDVFYPQGTVLQERDRDGYERRMVLDYEPITGPPLHPHCDCYIRPILVEAKSADPFHEPDLEALEEETQP